MKVVEAAEEATQPQWRVDEGKSNIPRPSNASPLTSSWGRWLVKPQWGSRSISWCFQPHWLCSSELAASSGTTTPSELWTDKLQTERRAKTKQSLTFRRSSVWAQWCRTLCLKPRNHWITGASHWVKHCEELLVISLRINNLEHPEHWAASFS